MDIDIQAVMGCTCARLRKASRRITQIYDRALAPTGLTGNQFGLLSRLYGAKLAGMPGVPIGVLAEWLGADPTTLNRTLKPLRDKNLIKAVTHASDARVRMVAITDKGHKALARAVPLWRKAQTQVETALGDETVRALNRLLDKASEV